MRADWAESLDAWIHRNRGHALRWLVAAGVLLVLALFFWRGPISERLLPDPRMNRQLERAQQALAQGKLSAADGSGARELFESVLAADPDQMAAREGLVQVRNAAIERATVALAKHRLLQARNNLELAESLSAPAVQLQSLKARLRDLEEASGDIAGLLAAAAVPDITDQAALALFDRVLQLDAENAAALEGRGSLLARWLGQAEALLAAGKVQEARQLVEKVVAVDPGHVDLPLVQGELGEAMARLQREQARVLELAQADERAGRIDSAADKYLQLVEAGDDSAAVQEGLGRLAAQAALQAQRQAADFQFRRANASLEKARHWSPQAPEIAVAEQRVAQSRMAQERLLRKPARGEREKLPQLLAEAEQAMTRGEFITPPGTSAWDKLRVASAISPESPQVLKLQREFGRRSLDCFERAMTANQLKRAQSCLEANLAVEPYSPAANDARSRLADRWLAYAEERIAASDFPEAEAAMASARHWQPTHPKLEATAARLKRARGKSR